MTDIVYWDLCSQPSTMQHIWHLPDNTRSAIGALLFSQVPNEHMWQMCKSLEMPWGMLCSLPHHPAWPVLQWVCFVLERTILGRLHRPPHPSQLLSGKSLALLSDLVCRWFLDDKSINVINWPSHFTDLNLIKNLWAIIHISEHSKPPSSTTACPGAH